MDFALRPARPEDYPRIVAIANAQLPEPITVEDIRHDDQLLPEGDPFLRLVSELPDGTIGDDRVRPLPGGALHAHQ